MCARGNQDYEREKVRINGIDYTESGGAQHVVFVLSNIIQTLSRSPSRQLTELEAFSVTRDILLQWCVVENQVLLPVAVMVFECDCVFVRHSNRTCFGGDSYDFASMLFVKDGMVRSMSFVVRPSSPSVQQLRFVCPCFVIPPAHSRLCARSLRRKKRCNSRCQRRSTALYKH
jgi:hypothetical protein